jgi:ABC-type branched-subunit amino acid transport system ATPase component
VLLDEPTDGNQPSIIDEIADLLHVQRHKRGLAIVLVEQNLEFIRRLSDGVLTIQKGQITGPLVPDDLGDEDLVAEVS